MEWLKHCIGAQSETEIIDLQDSFSVNSEVDKILTRKQSRVDHKARTKLIKNWHSKKVRKDRSVNRHHLINVCKWWTNHVANIKEMDIKVHTAMHQVFWNKHPHQILLQILEHCRQVLNPDTADMIIEEIQVLIDYYLKNEEFYTSKAFNSRVFIPKN